MEMRAKRSCLYMTLDTNLGTAFRQSISTLRGSHALGDAGDAPFDALDLRSLIEAPVIQNGKLPSFPEPRGHEGPHGCGLAGCCLACHRKNYGA